MRLYVIRHAEAAPEGQNGVERDEDRPLTAAGLEQSRRLALALKEHGVKLDRLLSSPLLRAKQTAEALVASWGDGAPEVQECECLAPGNKKKKVVRELLAAGGDALGVVGHNPDLAELIAWLVGDKEANVALAKAGTACIEFEGSPCKGCGALTWLVTPCWYA